jgi:hypothetical protein
MASPLLAQNQSEVEQLKKEVKELRKEVSELKGQKQAQPQEKPKPGDPALDEFIKGLPKDDPRISKEPIATKKIGNTTFKLIDVSLDALFAVGASSLRDEPLQNIQGGGHDPRKNGFTVQNVEVSLTGAVDPYFYAECHLIYFLDPLEGESVFELEEAFFVTTSLPAGLQVKGGQFFTEFGRINPQHPHAWHFVDQPVVLSRFFGPDGLRGPGVRAAWLAPLPFYSEFFASVQNANGETQASFFASEEFFEERPVAGRFFAEQDVRSADDMTWLVRWENGADVTEEISGKFGMSALFGPNATGADGCTSIYGLDLVVKWRPKTNTKGWPFVIFESEVLWRFYHANSQFDPLGPDGAAGTGDEPQLPSNTLKDSGMYAQLLVGLIEQWVFGVRVEIADGSGASYDRANFVMASPDTDPFRDLRARYSALVTYHVTEFSRFRVQYNYDRPHHTTHNEVHSVWFVVEVMIGAHPAHKY